jgi:hypothetical protein
MHSTTRSSCLQIAAAGLLIKTLYDIRTIQKLIFSVDCQNPLHKIFYAQVQLIQRVFSAAIFVAVILRRV